MLWKFIIKLLSGEFPVWSKIYRFNNKKQEIKNLSAV